MFKKFAAVSAAAVAAATTAVVGFAPSASAQTIGGCASPDTCAFINASGFSILAFANGSFAFIDDQAPFIGAGTAPTQNNFSTASQTPVAPRLGQWSFGSMALNTRLAGNTAAEPDGGVDATTVLPVAVGLMGLYGVLMVAVRRRADGAVTTA